MADSVTVYNGNTGGTNYTVATDDITISGGPAGQVQYVKLADGTPNGTAGIGGTANGLYVTPHQDMQVLTLQVPGNTAAPHAANSQIGTAISLGSAVRNAGGSGTILGVSLVDDDAVIGSVDVAFFNTTLTTPVANAATFDLTASADQLKLVEIVSLNYALGFTSFRFSRLMGLNIPYTCVGTSLVAYLIARTAATFTSTTGLTLNVYVARD